jgi:type IV pilus assembly protein PilE
MEQKEAGFTLVELMITVVIIGILSAIVVPSYKQYVLRGKLTDAFTKLSSLQLRMENFFQENRNYGTATVCGVDATASNSADFTYSCSTSNSDQNFTVLATGRSAAAGFQYSIDDAGAKGTVSVTSGWNGAGSTCWVTHSGGEC